MNSGSVGHPAAPTQRDPVPDKGGQVCLRFTDVSLRFANGTLALDGVSLDVDHGQFVSIIGPSGCGKSTLLRVASGLSEPTSGTAQCDRGDIGYVFQDPTLLPWRSVRDNIELFAELHQVDKHERKARAQQAMEMVGLAEFADQYPKALSGGMRSRASLARSLVLHPGLFLFDEPFAAVDEITRGNLNDEIITLFGVERFAAVFVTHSISEACYLASKVVVMTSRPGRIHAVVDVPFGYPRTPDLHFDQDFVDITKAVAEALRSGSARSGGER